jgi:MFS family permease
VLVVPCVVVVMDLTVLFLAMPSIVPDVGASATAALWITDVYGFLIAASLLTMGNLADRLGRRRALIGGAAVFAVASAAAALAPSAGLAPLRAPLPFLHRSAARSRGNAEDPPCRTMDHDGPGQPRRR